MKRISEISDLDELNRLVGMKHSEPLDEYFEPMQISKARKQERVELAERFEGEFLYVLALLFYEYPTIGPETAFYLEEGYMNAIRQSGVIPQRRQDEYGLIASSFAYGAILATSNHRDDPYFYSHDRARFMAEDQSNTVLNKYEFDVAFERGIGTKTWNTVMDGHERETHADVNGITVPIYQPFLVGGSEMMYPHDGSLGAGAEELVNCRCSVTFNR